MTANAHHTDRPPEPGTPGEVFLAFLKLGLTSFGGPIAHLGYFREEWQGIFARTGSEPR